MSRNIFLALFLLGISMATFSQQAGPARAFSSIELQPTVAYLKYNGKECRMARLLFKDGRCFDETALTISFNGLSASMVIPASKEGVDVFEVALPGAPVDKDVQALVTLKAGAQTWHARCIVSPTRKWDVYVLPHSHVDVGYTNVQPKVLKLHMGNIDEAIALAKKTQDYPVEARYKWNTEAMWVVDNYLTLSGEAKKKEFWDAVRKGWIGLDGAYGNINTSVTDSRQLMQMFYDATKEAKLQGVEVNTMFQGDVPGSSWGLAAQAQQTGIKYFLSGPNASDRIGNLAQWQDKPFYLLSPSGKQKMLFWQCQPYSIGYQIKGNKIPNFLTVEDPKPYYTGKPSENFLNPYLFTYLSGLEQKAFPYNMTILTWAMSDNAPIDPELPDAVKAWNERYASPRLVITSTKQFFGDFEQRYKNRIPEIAGDYTEYWTDGLGSAARETAINRNTTEELQQVDAIWAMKNKPAYPSNDFRTAWKNLLLFSEHTWGAYNSVSKPDDAKAIEQWKIKQAFALNAQKQTKELMRKALEDGTAINNSLDVFNTLSWPRTDLVTVPASLSSAGDIIVNEQGKKIPSQRLSSGELVFVAQNVPALGKSRFTIKKGKVTANPVTGTAPTVIENSLYKITADPATGTITSLEKKATHRQLVDSAGFNKYMYLPDDVVEKMETSRNASITLKENGPVLVSLQITADAPGAKKLVSAITLVNGIDRVEISNTIDKIANRKKEAVHFAFPFMVSNPKVRYNIPWGSIEAEADQLINSNRNWYTMQRWVDVSNANYGVTLSSPDAPLFQIGAITTGGLLGGLRNSPLWLKYTNQSSHLYSWVMNNLWHTNFRAEQDGLATFRYFITVHEQFDNYQANLTGMENHRPLVVAAARGKASAESLFNITGENVYVEGIKPCYDGNGILVHLINTGDKNSPVTIKRKQQSPTILESNLLEEDLTKLSNGFILPAKEIKTIKLRW
jgi:alpha-mannosidase